MKKITRFLNHDLSLDVIVWAAMIAMIAVDVCYFGVLLARALGLGS